MATTTGGTTYVTSTDLVANYPTASLALANRVDIVASGGPNSIKTSGYTITLADILGGNKFLYNSASPGTFTLPTSGLVDGMVVNVAQIGAGALTVSGGTIVGTTVTTAQYQGLQFVYASTGTTWYSVAPNATAPGLAIVTPTSIANSGGSASASGGAVTFTGVSSFSLNGVFSSTYDNYIVQCHIAGSTGMDVTCRMRAAGTDNSAGSYQYAQGLTQSAATGSQTTTGTSFLPTSNMGTASSPLEMNFYRPFTAANTSFLSRGWRSVDNYHSSTAGQHAVASSFDGFTLIASTGNITGVLRVYGLRNS